MATLRRYSPGTDSALKCEGCFRQRPEIVIEGYPTTRDEPRHLCYSCSVLALEEHPNLMARAVVSLILRREIYTPVEQFDE